MNNVGKNWEKDEEEKLIGEINKLVSIDKIAEKHQRHIGGVRARIKKILEDPIKSNKITDKAQVVIKYLAENEEKIQLSLLLKSVIDENFGGDERALFDEFKR